MNCIDCDVELIIGGSDDVYDSVFTVVNNYSCPSCDAFVEVFS
jgi:hypothetical protein|tara:strand:+ start:55 stop:183 length:129 start_codon:yes stop_codon:yes gene_type:complete